jgi:hypothetical protein
MTAQKKTTTGRSKTPKTTTTTTKPTGMVIKKKPAVAKLEPKKKLKKKASASPSFDTKKAARCILEIVFYWIGCYRVPFQGEEGRDLLTMLKPYVCFATWWDLNNKLNGVKDPDPYHGLLQCRLHEREEITPSHAKKTLKALIEYADLAGYGFSELKEEVKEEAKELGFDCIGDWIYDYDSDSAEEREEREQRREDDDEEDDDEEE